MPDEQQQQQTPGQDASTSSTPAQQQQWRIEDLPEPVQKMIKDLRQEAAGYRVALKDVQTAQQQRLADEGNYKALAEQRAADLAALTPKAERAEALENMIRASNSARINSVREDMRALIPVDYPPEKLSTWLDANLTRLTMPQAPNIDAGAGAGGGNAQRLTEDEKQMAVRFGMSEAQYIEAQKRAGKRQG